MLHALSDGNRHTMLEALLEGPATVNQLAALLPIARPGVSRHLRVLRDAGLGDVEQRAQFRVYALRPEPLAEVDTWLGHYRALWQNRLDALHTEIARGTREQGVVHVEDGGRVAPRAASSAPASRAVGRARDASTSASRRSVCS